MALEPGFLVIHSNQLEQLRSLLVQFCQRYPLSPLELEQVLVQSNGIAQWLKLAFAASPDEADPFARGLGIAAAMQVQLPGRFIWSMYQLALPEQQLPDLSVFSKDSLRWRIFRLLPALVTQDEFELLRRFISDDKDQQKRSQLALKLADLFDQYQVYRADWLADWAKGLYRLAQMDGEAKAMPDDQLWQAKLWQAILAELPAEQQQQSRFSLHQAFLQQVKSWKKAPKNLPRRVIIFGISSLPQQMLEVLSALAPYCQILLAVLNPCQLYWADIIAEKDKVKAAQRRQPQKAGFLPFASAEQLSGQAQPLLAAWGKQGRDYIRLLDQFDETAAHKELFAHQKVDLFESPNTSHLLGQLQDDILQLRSITETQSQWPALTAEAARSISFQKAHSPLREVEILHDHLLQLFAQNPELGAKDVMVMVPDINLYAPLIEAVFGKVPMGDLRYIPYSISDQNSKKQQPLLQALDVLLSPEQQRLNASTVFDMLDISALQQRFGLKAAALPKIKQWIEGAGIRWGLDQQHRQQLGLQHGFEQNSWLFGIRRMLLGYVAGDTAPWQGIAPYADVAGLEAAELGPVLVLLQKINELWQQLAVKRSPADWHLLFTQLLQDFFAPDELESQQLVQQLQQQLQSWLDNTTGADLEEELSLQIARQAVLEPVQAGGLQQKFFSGRVNFATLLPMRSIPFAVICLLGMNDGAYPRVQQRQDFDLMALDYRSGDRSRRDDDRYLLLEALLSARQQLYISWVGFSVFDNSARAPSVLVSQLRDHLSAGWSMLTGVNGADGSDLLEQITSEHPLQPFSRRYREAGSGLVSYQQEWASLHHKAGAAVKTQALPVLNDLHWTLKQASDFMREPVRFFFNERLKVRLELPELASINDEVFALDPLERWQMQQQLVAELKRSVEQSQNGQHNWQQQTEQQLELFRLQGRLAVGSGAVLMQQDLVAGLEELAAGYQQFLTAYPTADVGFYPLRFVCQQGELAEQLTGFRQGPPDKGGLAYAELLPTALIKDRSIVWRHLVAPYLKLLLCCASGLPLTLYVLSRVGQLVLQPIEKQQAQMQLGQILQLMQQGLSEPLALEFSVGVELMKQLEKGAAVDDKLLSKLERVYTGDDFNNGALQRSPYLQRAFADFDALWQKGQLEKNASALYAPLLAVNYSEVSA
ncbi:exodeoxyribonuclease V, gamma subunit [Rheinheimera sp. A13L]|uniref:exodeoxyribonuclease V subunit gamma n=1 Tax=Rheinheimera sp. A13L TaxID=506534 RepID=UPI0002124D51|nr:exodeoxyribonuclease V subunit gamma [Rheinheimera sp. A13L]EGM78575.1 exodeoxyribonuclease V, gamma subunit [Rheinheimera sp. A13L]